MENVRRITSFSVDHDFIVEGIYISRIDGEKLTEEEKVAANLFVFANILPE